MRITGNTVGTTMPRSDWNQTNPKKADYIRNKPDIDASVAAALQAAKDSGEFNGKNGADGVSVTHSWDGTTLTISSASGTSSANLKGDTGAKGSTGSPGKSCTHYWVGTELVVTSASGTSRANLKGAKGTDGYTPIKGVDYFDGKDGKDGNSGVYVGSGDMPDDCNVQIDPNGEFLTLEGLISVVIAALPVYDGSVTSV